MKIILVLNLSLKALVMDLMVVDVTMVQESFSTVIVISCMEAWQTDASITS